MKKKKASSISIGALLDKVIKNLGKREPLTEEDIIEVWKEAAGEAAARHSRPVSFRKSALVVNVDGSSWLYELTMKKKEILKKLEGAFKPKNVREIRFRIGEINKK